MNARLDRAGRCGGYGAALAMTPYLVIKLVWVLGSLVGLLPTGEDMGLLPWVALNTATIGMSAIGIGIALATVRPWGQQIPALPWIFFAWIGTGFLTSMIPLLAIGPFLPDAVAAHEDTGASMPGWEGVLIQLSFTGMALGLAAAIPAYVARRWPGAVRRAHMTSFTGGHPRRWWSLILSACAGIVWAYWALGGTRGLQLPTDASWRVLTGLLGGWALAATVSSTVRRGLAIIWVGSGAMFAWSGWLLVFTVIEARAGRDHGPVIPPSLGLAAALYAVAMAGAVGMLAEALRGSAVREHAP